MLQRCNKPQHGEKNTVLSISEPLNDLQHLIYHLLSISRHSHGGNVVTNRATRSLISVVSTNKEKQQMQTLAALNESR